MLSVLRIKNFVLISALELELEPGFNVLTGETGAGKSSIVEALRLVLGDRPKSDVVRAGAGEAEVEALFEVGASDVTRAALASAGIEAPGGEVVVRRVVSEKGRSRAYLNGKLCTHKQLSTVAKLLADVTSQHESVRLIEPSEHLEFLDRHAELIALRGELGAKVDELSRADAVLEELSGKSIERSERESFFRYQLETIDKLAPTPGELETLAVEHARLKHGTRLADVTGRAAAALDGDEGLGDRLGRIASDLEHAASLDVSLRDAADEASSLWNRARELGRSLERYAERIEVDPARLEEVQERMFKLERLARQHGHTLDDVLAARERIARELETLAGDDARIPLLLAARSDLLAECARVALELSRSRAQAAGPLGAEIARELEALGMCAARVEVGVQRRKTSEAVDSDGGEEASSQVRARLGAPTVDGARLTRQGLDRVELLFSPNPGVEPRPLREVASGGELSRVLLALKCVLARAGAERLAGVQVLDEVDAGLGGAAADCIGRAIEQSAQHRQVLCVTHLAGIAVYADAQFVVTKDMSGATTTSHAAAVRRDERVAEVARMLTGRAQVGSAQRAARELLARARRARAA